MSAPPRSPPLRGGPSGSRGPEVVLLIHHHLRLGGIERKIADIATALDRHPAGRGRRFYLLLDETPPAVPDERHFYDAVASSPVTVIYRPQARVLRALCPYSLFVLWQAVRLRPHTLLGFLRRAGVYAIIVKLLLPWRGMRAVVSDDTVPSRALAHDTRGRPMRRLLISALVRAFYPRADCIVVPSDHARDDLVSGFAVPRSMIVVNRNWTLTRHVGAPATSPDYDMIYVGRIDPEKNLELLIDLVAAVSALRGPTRACIVGSGSQEARVARHAAERGIASLIDFVGPRRNVDEFLRRARVFCLTSEFEGLPIAALEAMAAGIPVLTTPYPGAEELVRDGLTGHVCRSPDEYVQRLVQLLSDPTARDAMGRAAARHVGERHGFQNLDRFVRVLTDSGAAAAAEP